MLLHSSTLLHEQMSAICSDPTPEESADLFMQQMQASHLDETRIDFIGQHSEGIREEDHHHQHHALAGRLFMAVTTGIDPDKISSMFEIVQHRLFQLDEEHIIRRRVRRISKIRFIHYTFQEFPDNIGGATFPQITSCTIANCRNLISVGSIVRHFARIELLDILSCPGFTSLQSLSDIPNRSNLCMLKIKNCGLVCTNGNDWDEGIEALSRSRYPLEVVIQECRQLNAIPSSIQYLQNLSSLTLDLLPKLTILPPEIGSLTSLTLLTLKNTGLLTLPPEIGRLKSSCEVFIQGSKILYPPKCYRGSIVAMRKCFAERRVKVLRGFIRLSILLRRARSRAVERLFKPGGDGYKRCRDNFITMSNKRSKG